MESFSAETSDAVFNWDCFELSGSNLSTQNLSMCVDPVSLGTTYRVCDGTVSRKKVERHVAQVVNFMWTNDTLKLKKQETCACLRYNGLWTLLLGAFFYI